MTVEIANYDKAYPIRVADGWGGKVSMTLEGAKELLKELERITGTLENLSNENPKKCEPEKKVVYFVDSYEETTKAVQITAEQEKLLDWLIKQDYFIDELDITDKVPDAEDLT